MDDAAMMGTPEAARDALMTKAREWREIRQPTMATRKELNARDRREHQVRFELANVALLWLWHEEHRN